MASNTLTTMIGVFQGSGVADNFWLYWSSTFIDVLLTMMSVVMFYHTVKSYLETKRYTLHYPVNLFKAFIMCVSVLVFFRVAPDMVIQLLWQETSTSGMEGLQHLNQVFDTLAIFPFLASVYVLIRAGPLIEFQLLRQPIPTNLWPSWRMVRRPVISIGIIVLLSLLVVSTKLT